MLSATLFANGMNARINSSLVSWPIFFGMSRHRMSYILTVNANQNMRYMVYGMSAVELGFCCVDVAQVFVRVMVLESVDPHVAQAGP